MTNRIAITIALLILALFLADALEFHSGLPVLDGKQMVRIVEYLSFWR